MKIHLRSKVEARKLRSLLSRALRSLTTHEDMPGFSERSWQKTIDDLSNVTVNSGKEKAKKAKCGCMTRASR